MRFDDFSSLLGHWAGATPDAPALRYAKGDVMQTLSYSRLRDAVCALYREDAPAADLPEPGEVLPPPMKETEPAAPPAEDAPPIQEAPPAEEEILAELAAPDVANDPGRMTALMKEQAQLMPVAEVCLEYRKAEDALCDSRLLLEEEERNFKDVTGILRAAQILSEGREHWPEAERVRVHLLIESDQYENLLDAQEKYGIFVRIMDTERMCVQELFKKWPLFAGLQSGKKTINLLILGQGGIAENVLYNALWMGQTAGASLKVCYLGEDASDGSVPGLRRMYSPTGSTVKGR